MKACERLFSALPRIVRYISLAVLTFTALCILFLPPWVQYTFYLEVLKENSLTFIALGIGALVIYGVLLIGVHKSKFLDSERRFHILVLIVCVIMLCLQFWLATELRFVAGFDSYMATNVAEHRQNSIYFSRFSHNMFFAGICTMLAQLASITNTDPYLWMEFGGCVLTTLSIAFASCAARKMAGSTSGVAVLLAGAMWLGLSPITQTPYTDSYGIVWPTLVLYLYACNIRPQIKWPLMIFISIFGYFMKPTTLAILGAIIFVEACCYIKKRCAKCRQSSNTEILNPSPSHSKTSNLSSQTHQNAQSILTTVAISLVALVASASLCTAIKNVPDVAFNDEMDLGLAHYLLVGIGPNRGGYSQDVMDLTTSIETKEERSAIALEQWRSRVNKLGISGLAYLALAKTMTTFGNGSFFWGGDEPTTIDTTNPLLIDLYGLVPLNVQDSSYYRFHSPWSLFAHTVWIGILIGCVLGWLRGRTASCTELVIYGALLLFYLYSLIFETNPRYPFVFAPEFMILASIGCKCFIQKLQDLRNKRKGKEISLNDNQRGEDEAVTPANPIS